jgi:hypothetical protein
MSEGLRVAIPAAKPPPAHNLPDVAALVGVPRSRVIAEFGEPFYGCWVDQNGGLVKGSCSDLRQFSYQFYHRPSGPGGGAELQLDFDDAGVCVRAHWQQTQ